MKDISVPFKYCGQAADNEHGLDMIITVQSFEVDDDRTVEIEDYEISTDYVCVSPRPFDGVVNLVNSMLNDGRHTQELIFDAMHVQEMDAIEAACIEAWDECWEEVKADRGIEFDHYLI